MTDVDVHQRIAVIAVTCSTLGDISHAARLELSAQLTQALTRDDVEGIVVGGRCDPELADEVALDAFLDPSLSRVIALVESSAKPVVADVSSLRVGSAFELALGAHYRVVEESSVVGLPAVKFAMVPGAGGSQRLPRAVGLELACSLILSGELRAAHTLSRTRLFDKIVSGGESRASALEFIQGVPKDIVRYPLLRDIEVTHPNVEGFLGFVRSSNLTASNTSEAVKRGIDCLEAAAKEDFALGLAGESDAFSVLANSERSRSVRHGYLSEQRAATLRHVSPGVAPRKVVEVGIVGAGTMGSGICMCFLNAGIPVTIVESSRSALDRGLSVIRKTYEATARKGKMTSAQVEKTVALLSSDLSFDGLRSADLVIEAVFEDYGVKEKVFRELDTVAKEGAILASNTSSLDLDRIARSTRRPEDVVGMHFFSPANVMKLLEVVRGARTSEDVLVTVMGLAKRIGKAPVVSKVCDGFIGNRMIEQYLRQAGFLLDEGALPQQVDRALERFGMAMGPFRMSDLAGNDISWAIRKRRVAENSPITSSKVPDLVCELSRFGQKSGAGWYDYRPGDRTAYPAPVVVDLIQHHSDKLGIKRRVISDQEIVDRLIFALVNEGAEILRERIAAQSSDIDVVYLTGYGFPSWRGGPMFYADRVGLPAVVTAMYRFQRGYQGDTWRPSPLLVELAGGGKNVGGYVG